MYISLFNKVRNLAVIPESFLFLTRNPVSNYGSIK